MNDKILVCNCSDIKISLWEQLIILSITLHLFHFSLLRKIQQNVVHKMQLDFFERKSPYKM